MPLWRSPVPTPASIEYEGVTRSASFMAVGSSLALVGITKQSLTDATVFTNGGLSLKATRLLLRKNKLWFKIFLSEHNFYS